MTLEALAAIAARNAARTQGKWTQHLVDDTTVVCRSQDICCTFPEGGLDDDVDFNTDTEQREKDAAFIAHASEDIPSWLAEITRLTAALAEAENRGYDAAKEQAARIIDNLVSHLNLEQFLLVLRDKEKAAEISQAVIAMLEGEATAIRAMVRP